jgi:hypothetical protein
LEMASLSGATTDPPAAAESHRRLVAPVEAVDVGVEFFGEPLRPTSDGQFVDMGTISGVARFDAATLSLVRPIEEPAFLQGAMSRRAAPTV